MVIKVKSHKRKGRVVRSHARTVKKGKKFVSDAGHKVVFGADYHKKFRKAYGSLHNKITEMGDQHSGPGLLQQNAKKAKKNNPESYKEHSYARPGGFTKNTLYANTSGHGNKSLRRQGKKVTSTRGTFRPKSTR